MFEFLNSPTLGFMPHGYCLNWNGPLLAVFITGNLGIALAYFLIPAALRYFIGKRQDFPYPHIFKLFAAFILFCGLTHIAKVWTLYQPAYWVEAVLDLTTAIISAGHCCRSLPFDSASLAVAQSKRVGRSE